MIHISEEVKKRFFAKTKQGPLMTDGTLRCSGYCLDWTGATTGRPGTPPEQRHGVFWFGKLRIASRLAWMIYHNGEEIPEELEVIHFCQRGICVRENHLFAASSRVNTVERVLSNRMAHGERHGLAKLKESEIRKIFELNREGVRKIHIAKAFDISRMELWKILTRRVWRRVPIF